MPSAISVKETKLFTMHQSNYFHDNIKKNYATAVSYIQHLLLYYYYMYVDRNNPSENAKYMYTDTKSIQTEMTLIVTS